jgi:hypothetical protein
MNEKQALEILKSALDLATSKGVFTRLEDSFTIIQAYNKIAEKIQKEETDATADRQQS